LAGFHELDGVIIVFKRILTASVEGTLFAPDENSGGGGGGVGSENVPRLKMQRQRSVPNGKKGN